MSWWNPSTWFGAASLAAAPAAASGGLDLSDFERASWASGSLTANDVIALGTYGMGCRPDTPAEQVPPVVLDAIGWHPVAYAGESALVGPALDPELYYLRGDEKAVAECEAWLRPLLVGQRAPLLNQIARASALGSVPVVLDYGVADLRIEVTTKDGEGTRNRNLPGHAHYVASHELWMGDCELEVTRADKLVAVRHGGQSYGGEDAENPGARRGYLAVWDPKPSQDGMGLWRGQGSRRRIFKDWIEEGMSRLWEIRYIERGVDVPRVGYAPQDTEVTLANGQKKRAVDLLRAQIMSLRNGSVITLPSTLIEGSTTEHAYKVDVLNMPDRHEIFRYAVDSRGTRMLLGSFGQSDLNKANEEQFMDSVQRVCDFVARTLTRIVNSVLRLRYGDAAPFVQVLANDIPKRKLRLIQQIFANAANSVAHTKDGKVYTLGELVDPEILDQLGVKARRVEDAAHEPDAPPAPGQPGRPIDVGSGREDRRDVSKTVDGEGDTGGPTTDGAPADRTPQEGA